MTATYSKDRQDKQELDKMINTRLHTYPKYSQIHTQKIDIQ